MLTAADTNSRSSVWDAIRGYFASFAVLQDNSRAYWAVQAVNVLDCTAYFSMISIASLFLVQNIGLSEVYSGYTITAYGMLVSITLFGAGFITDRLGVRKSLFTAMLIQGASRVGVVFCGFTPDLPGREWLVIAFLIFGAPGNAGADRISNRQQGVQQPAQPLRLVQHLVPADEYRRRGRGTLD